MFVFFLFFVVVVFHLNKGWSTQTRTFHPITAVTHRFVAVSSADIVWSTVWSLMDGNISTAQSLKKNKQRNKICPNCFLVALTPNDKYRNMRLFQWSLCSMLVAPVGFQSNDQNPKKSGELENTPAWATTEFRLIVWVKLALQATRLAGAHDNKQMTYNAVI